MSSVDLSKSSPWQQGARDALPLLGGYIPVAILLV